MTTAIAQTLATFGHAATAVVLLAVIVIGGRLAIALLAEHVRTIHHSITTTTKGPHQP